MARHAKAVQELLINAVEDLMLRGLNRPATIMRMVEVRHDGTTHTLGDQRTVNGYIERVQRRWLARNEEALLERQRLLSEAQEVVRRAWVTIAAIANDTKGSPLAIVAALNSALKAQDQQAKLLGLYVQKSDVTHQVDVSTLEALRDQRCQESSAQLSAPIAELYGVDLTES